MESQDKQTVGLLTFHYAQNFGALFQAIALQNAISSLGLSPMQIDYHNRFLDQMHGPKTRKSLLKPKTIAKIILQNSVERYNPGFKDFRTKHLIQSHDVYFETLPKPDEYSFFLVGSDQVWNTNCNGNDLNFFLPEIPSSKKITYAVSTGAKLQERYQGTPIVPLMNDFETISFRERDSSLEASGFLPGTKCITSIDPTMLLSASQWSELKEPRRISGKRYILLYLIREDPCLIKEARRFAKEKHLDIKYINLGFRPYLGVKNLFLVTPGQWLYLFEKAEYVFTNSFHGICFSCIFNRPFSAALLRQNEIANNRIKQILDFFGLRSRLIPNNSPTLECDFSCFNSIVINERKAALAYLKQKLCNR